MGWRILGGVSAALAGLAARKAMILGWKTTTRKVPPSNPESPETQWVEAIAWAVASGAHLTPCPEARDNYQSCRNDRA